MTSPAENLPATTPAPLLEIDKLTVRFGGLTAVSEVDLAVRPGEIFAVIGPNGAGKTTVFNAIVGIYEPTEGRIRFEGQELARPVSKANYVRWALTGLGVGIFLLLFFANIDLIWQVSVKNNYLGKAEGFQVAAAVHDFAEYLKAEPRITSRFGRYHVVSYNEKFQFGSAGSEVEAHVQRANVIEMATLGGRQDTIEQRASSFVILSADRSRVLDEVPTAAQAVDRVQSAFAAERAARGARRLRILTFLIGVLLGAAGAFTVFRQTRRAPAFIASRGIARTFQNIRLFQDMSVLENVLVGMDRHLFAREPWWKRSRLPYFAIPLAIVLGFVTLALALRWSVLSPAAAGALLVICVAATALYVAELVRLGAFSRNALAQHAEAVEKARELLRFVGLESKTDEISKNLAYGDQRRLEIARALATRPKLLLLDEPAAGMNPRESAALTKLVRQIRDLGTTVLLIEHHMRVVMGISDRIAVLEYGRKIAEGTPGEIRENPRVIEAYLGKEELG